MQVNSRRGTESVRRRLSRFSRELSAHPSANAPFTRGLREALAAHQEHFTLELPSGGHA
ncbi:hypothetical protein [Streptomyces sp. TRM49041]|uniref:hypothetical protein n=1 Tax=Streptomyces sp. TRM49041 TaxID=2603216 RepID=UPI0016568726|nr:hypothetical protein [Streptomyces sp. TRM49041]